MISTLFGSDGSNELREFAVRLGLQTSWLQHAGTEREHYDLFAHCRNAAIRAGAIEVDRRTFVMAIRAKRTAIAGQ